MSHERSTYVWYTPPTKAGRQSLRDRLLGIGCELVHVKGFGDHGVAWTPGQPTAGFAQPQWSRDWLDDLAPLKVALWGYPHPGDNREVESLLACLRERWPDDDLVVLNPEVEWRYPNQWDNDYARGWVRSLRERVRAEFGRELVLGHSSCPSWWDFPYEGFAETCDIAYPQHYWPDELMARGEDQVEAHIRRAGADQPCVPILTACREYNDAGVVALARDALEGFPRLDGFSAWEAGNGAFQAAAMAAAFAMLPAVEEPAAPEGAIAMGGGFRAFYDQFGGLPIFGLPLTPEFRERLEDGKEYTVQYFERARFEWHPGAGTPHDVLLGRVGAEALARRAA